MPEIHAESLVLEGMIEFIYWLNNNQMKSTVRGFYRDSMVIAYSDNEKKAVVDKLKELFPDGIWEDNILDLEGENND